MREQDVVLVHDPLANTPHYGVVIRLFDDVQQALILCGTTKQSSATGVFVDRGTSAAKALGLTQPTWFYPRNVVGAEYGATTPQRGRCPLTLFTRLQEVAEQGCIDFGSNLPVVRVP